MAILNAVGNSLTGRTGTGSFVGSNSPTLVTPTLGAASATSLSFSSTAGIIGTTTNDNAASGSVGQFVSSIVPFGSAVSLTSTTPANITSVLLGAGDWDVWAILGVGGTATASGNMEGCITSSSATIVTTLADNTSYIKFAPALNFATFGTSFFAVPAARISLSGTTTIFLCVNLTFSGGTGVAYGALRARRRR